MQRRALILAGLGLAAAGAAEALRPHDRLVLLKNGKMEDGIPKTVGPWTAEIVDGLVSPEMAGKLAQALYKEIVSRTYFDDTRGAAIMLLVAYGDTQSDLLQLHRPEVCYPAVGFTLESSESVRVPILPGVSVPARQVVASTRQRQENILYWTRIGEALPQSISEQREARFDNAVHGFVADGALIRFSVIGDSQNAFHLLDEFVPQFLRQVPNAMRPAFVGTQLAKAIVA
jgi:EpsI family protein